MKHYCQMHTGDYQMIEVAYDFDKETGKALVRFEKPDEKYVFKVLECELPGYVVKLCIGFTETEQQQLLEFCMHNAGLLLTEEG